MTLSDTKWHEMTLMTLSKTQHMTLTHIKQQKKTCDNLSKGFHSLPPKSGIPCTARRHTTLADRMPWKTMTITSSCASPPFPRFVCSDACHLQFYFWTVPESTSSSLQGTGHYNADLWRYSVFKWLTGGPTITKPSFSIFSCHGNQQ